MAATGLTFEVTITSTGSAYDISGDKIYVVLESGTGSKILYDNGGATLSAIVVDESPADIQTASEALIALTDETTSDTFYIHVDKIRSVIDNGTGSKVYFDAKNAEDSIFSVTEDRTAIRVLVAAEVVPL